MQELDKFNFKINVLQKKKEKYVSFTINNELRFIDRFRFLSSSLNSLAKSLTKNDLLFDLLFYYY